MRRGPVLGLCLAALAACSPAEPTPAETEAAVKANLSWYLQPAFRAAYGADAPVPREIARAGEKVALLYSPNLLTDLGDGRVAVISTGLPASACQDCGGAVAVAYLRRSGDRFTLLQKWDDVGPYGGLGDAPAVGVASGLFENPALQVNATTRKDDCETTTAALYELAPSGPTARAKDILIARDAADAEPASSGDLRPGVILPGVKGQSFVVRYREKPMEEATYAPGPSGAWTPKGDFTAPDC